MKNNKKLFLLLIIILISSACAFGSKASTPETEVPAKAQSVPTSADLPTEIAAASEPAEIDLSILGGQQRVEDGGFAFRVLPDYALNVSGGMVSMLAPDADPDTGPVFQLMGWKNETEKTNEQLYDELKRDTPMTVSEASTIQVAGMPGLSADITGDNNGKTMQGKVAMVMATPNQQFVLMVGAPESEWEMVAPYFDAVLASVEFFDLETPVPVSSLQSGRYAYTNGNTVRDVVVYKNVAYTATLGGMLAWNLQSGYVMRYTPLDGMTHVSANAVTYCNIPEARILVGTLKGLSIYDPSTGLWEERSLVPQDSQLQTSKITRLVCDQANNRLLIGYNGLGILDLKSGEFQRFTKKDGLAADDVTGIAVAGKDIWVASTLKGLSQIAGGKITTYTAAQGMPDEHANALQVAKDGSLWVGTPSGIVSFKNGKWTLYGSDTPAKLNAVGEIVFTADGKLWAATAPLGAGRLCQFNPQSGACDREYIDSENLPILALTVDSADHPIFGTNNGLYTLDGETVIPLRNEEHLVSNFVDSFAFTPDGQLWLGTDRGIQILDPADPAVKWTTFKKSQNAGLGGDWGSAIAISPQGVVWVAVINGQASRYENGTWSAFKEISSFNVVTVDSEGRAWFGDDGKGIIVLNADGSPAMKLTAADGLPSDKIYALLTDTNGTVWIGSDSGLAKYESGKLSVVFSKDDTRLPNPYIRDLALAPDGSLMIGTFTAVARFDGNSPETLLNFLKDGYADARLTTLAVSPSGALWVGTDKGLLHSEDLSVWERLTTQDGLMTDYISALTADRFGAVWVGGGGSNFDGGGILQIVP